MREGVEAICVVCGRYAPPETRLTPTMHPDCYADAAPAQAGPPALDVRSLRFREAVRQVFEAPGDWGPAKGYYRGDIDHFIDMLVDRLSRTGEPSDE